MSSPQESELVSGSDLQATTDAPPPDLTPVDPRPCPKPRNRHELWAFGFFFDPVGVQDVPRLLDIENSFFGMQFPGYVREVVQTQRRKKEVRLIQGWVNVRATEVVPELESYNPRTWRPVPVISLFRYTKKALEDLPAQGDVDYLTKLMGSPPIWWEVLDWDE